MRKIWQRPLIDRFIKRVAKFNNLFPGAPLGDKYFEYQLFLACIDCGIKVSNYEFNSHSPGTDMQIEGKNISLKGGRLGREYYEFSGSRTTSFRTLQEKIDYLSHPNEDYILSLVAKNDKKNCVIKYNLLLIDYKKLDFDSLVWREKENSKGKINYYGNGNFEVRIINSMSDQAWFKLPLDYIKKNEYFEVGY